MNATVTLPVVTNETKLFEGEELLLEVAPKNPARKRTHTDWKDDVASTARAKAKATTKATQHTSKAAPTMVINSEV